MHTVGEPKGVKLQGGLHELITREIEIECLPDEIPGAVHGRRQRADDRPEHPRRRHSADGIDQAAEPAGFGDLARGRDEGRSRAGCGGRRRSAPAAAAEPEVIKKGKKEEEGAARRREEEEERRSSRWPVAGPMPDEIEFLVVGLGNPGAEYENTPHNLGFLVIDRLAEAHAIRVSRKENMSRVGLGTIRGKRVALAKPQTFMNLSGPAVKGLLERYGLATGSLDVGLRRARSSVAGRCASGRKVRRRGTTGVKSVIGSLGTQRDLPGFGWEFIPGIRSGMEQSLCSRRSSGHRSRKWRRWSGEEPRLSNPYSLKASKSP